MTTPQQRLRLAVAKAERDGKLLPQTCPRCEMSLVDPSVPEEYAFAAGLFTMALGSKGAWICPYCGGRWT